MDALKQAPRSHEPLNGKWYKVVKERSRLDSILGRDGIRIVHVEAYMNTRAYENADLFSYRLFIFRSMGRKKVVVVIQPRNVAWMIFVFFCLSTALCD